MGRMIGPILLKPMTGGGVGLDLILNSSERDKCRGIVGREHVISLGHDEGNLYLQVSVVVGTWNFVGLQE